MKVFDLACPDGHRFEGWFASAEQFRDQCGAHAVRCPLCESADIRREPSAPRLNFGGTASDATGGAGASTSTSTSASTAASTAASPLASRVMDQLRQLVERTEDVGPRFAEEARRIHYDETPPRPIRGIATDAERRALHDEGIETLTVPIPRALTETLQ